MQSQSQLPKVSTRLGLVLLEARARARFFSENESLGSVSFTSIMPTHWYTQLNTHTQTHLYTQTQQYTHTHTPTHTYTSSETNHENRQESKLMSVTLYLRPNTLSIRFLRAVLVCSGGEVEGVEGVLEWGTHALCIYLK